VSAPATPPLLAPRPGKSRSLWMEGSESPPRAVTTPSTAPPSSGGVPSMRHRLPPRASGVKPLCATTASRLTTEQAGGAHEQQDGHRAEDHEVGELGKEPPAVRIDEADDHAAGHGAAQAPEAADDDDHERVGEDLPLGAGIEREERAAGHTREAGEKRGEAEHQREQPVDVDADRVHHLAVVHAGADDGAELRAVVEQAERQRDHGAEDDQQEA